MCGIGGIRKYGKKPIEEYMIRLLLTGMEKRGNDATGVAMQNKKGDVFTLKDSCPAWTFVSSKVYEDWINNTLTEDVEQVIVHTRAATKGSPFKSENNHPMFAGKAAIVHNGKLENDDRVFEELDLKRMAETDTDIIRAIVDKFGITDEAIDKLNKLRGSAAIAALSPAYPGLMLLGRSGSPLTIGSTDDFLVFASEKNIIHRAMKPLVERFKIPFQRTSIDMAFSPYPNDSMWILGPEGLQLHRALKTQYGTYHNPVRRVYVDYKKRQDEWLKKAGTDNNTKPKWEQKVTVIEPNSSDILLKCPHCNKPLVLAKHQVTMDLNKLLCPKDKGGCGKSLKGAYTNRVN